MCGAIRTDCNLNEIVESWCYANEQETVEHAFMNVVTMLCGLVRLVSTEAMMHALVENDSERKRRS
jgi:hypothetical protein